MLNIPVSSLVLFQVIIASFQPGLASWRKVSTRHFELLTTSCADDAAAAVEHLERVRPYLEKATAAGPSRGPVQIVAFSSYREYQPYQWTDYALGYAVPRDPRSLIVVQSLDSPMLRLLVHEYVHLLLRRSGVTYATWLEEGLAEFYSTVAVDRDTATLGEFAAGNDQRLQSSKWLPMEALATSAHGPPLFDVGGTRVFYSQAWALVHMLHLDQRYAYGLDRLLPALRRATPAPEAFRATYDKTLEQVGADLETYVRQGRHRVRWIGTSPPPEPVEIHAGRPASDEVNNALAQVRVFAKRPAR